MGGWWWCFDGARQKRKHRPVYNKPNKVSRLGCSRGNPASANCALRAGVKQRRGGGCRTNFQLRTLVYDSSFFSLSLSLSLHPLPYVSENINYLEIRLIKRAKVRVPRNRYSFVCTISTFSNHPGYYSLVLLFPLLFSSFISTVRTLVCFVFCATFPSILLTQLLSSAKLQPRETILSVCETCRCVIHPRSE